MDDRRRSILKQKLRIPLQEVMLPDFPDEDTVTTTVTRSRRVSFGTNFIKEFIKDSAVSTQCVSEYEQAFSSSDSSNANSSRSGHGSHLFEHSTFSAQENEFNSNDNKNIISKSYEKVESMSCVKSQQLSKIYTDENPLVDDERYEFNVVPPNLFMEKGNLSRTADLSMQNFKSIKTNSDMLMENKHEDFDTSINRRAKQARSSRTICFSTDSPTTEMEFTEGCINLAKSIFEKKNKDVTVTIQGKGRKSSSKQCFDETIVFGASDAEMSITKCVDDGYNDKGRKSGSKQCFDETIMFGASEADMSVTKCVGDGYNGNMDCSYTESDMDETDVRKPFVVSNGVDDFSGDSFSEVNVTPSTPEQVLEQRDPLEITSRSFAPSPGDGELIKKPFSTSNFVDSFMDSMDLTDCEFEVQKNNESCDMSISETNHDFTCPKNLEMEEEEMEPEKDSDVRKSFKENLVSMEITECVKLVPEAYDSEEESPQSSSSSPMDLTKCVRNRNSEDSTHSGVRNRLPKALLKSDLESTELSKSVRAIDVTNRATEHFNFEQNEPLNFCKSSKQWDNNVPSTTEHVFLNDQTSRKSTHEESHFSESNTSKSKWTSERSHVETSTNVIVNRSKTIEFFEKSNSTGLNRSKMELSHTDVIVNSQMKYFEGENLVAQNSKSQTKILDECQTSGNEFMSNEQLIDRIEQNMKTSTEANFHVEMDLSKSKPGGMSEHSSGRISNLPFKSNKDFDERDPLEISQSEKNSSDNMDLDVSLPQRSLIHSRTLNGSRNLDQSRQNKVEEALDFSSQGNRKSVLQNRSLGVVEEPQINESLNKMDLSDCELAYTEISEVRCVEDQEEVLSNTVNNESSAQLKPEESLYLPTVSSADDFIHGTNEKMSFSVPCPETPEFDSSDLDDSNKPLELCKLAEKGPDENAQLNDFCDAPNTEIKSFEDSPIVPENPRARKSEPVNESKGEVQESCNSSINNVCIKDSYENPRSSTNECDSFSSGNKTLDSSSLKIEECLPIQKKLDSSPDKEIASTSEDNINLNSSKNENSSLNEVSNDKELNLVQEENEMETSICREYPEENRMETSICKEYSEENQMETSICKELSKENQIPEHEANGTVSDEGVQNEANLHPMNEMDSSISKDISINNQNLSDGESQKLHSPKEGSVVLEKENGSVTIPQSPVEENIPEAMDVSHDEVDEVIEEVDREKMKDVENSDVAKSNSFEEERNIYISSRVSSEINTIDNVHASNKIEPQTSFSSDLVIVLGEINKTVDFSIENAEVSKPNIQSPLSEKKSNISNPSNYTFVVENHTFVVGDKPEDTATYSIHKGQNATYVLENIGEQDHSKTLPLKKIEEDLPLETEKLISSNPTLEMEQNLGSKSSVSPLLLVKDGATKEEESIPVHQESPTSPLPEELNLVGKRNSTSPVRVRTSNKMDSSFSKDISINNQNLSDGESQKLHNPKEGSVVLEKVNGSVTIPQSPVEEDIPEAMDVSHDEVDEVIEEVDREKMKDVENSDVAKSNSFEEERNFYISSEINTINNVQASNKIEPQTSFSSDLAIVLGEINKTVDFSIENAEVSKPSIQSPLSEKKSNISNPSNCTLVVEDKVEGAVQEDQNTAYVLENIGEQDHSKTLPLKKAEENLSLEIDKLISPNQTLEEEQGEGLGSRSPESPLILNKEDETMEEESLPVDYESTISSVSGESSSMGKRNSTSPVRVGTKRQSFARSPYCEKNKKNRLSSEFEDSGNKHVTDLPFKDITNFIVQQSKEANCLWKINEMRHFQGKGTGLWSFSFVLIDTEVVIEFALNTRTDTINNIAKSFIRFVSKDFTAVKSKVVGEFGFQKIKQNFEEEAKSLKNVRNIPYFLDFVNLSVAKLLPFLHQLLIILKEYPGSRLCGQCLTFRLYSFPAHFSSNVTIDINHYTRMNKNCLTFESHFGNLNKTKIENFFEESLKSENSLIKFIVSSTLYIISLEKEIGLITKRNHIRLLKR